MSKFENSISSIQIEADRLIAENAIQDFAEIIHQNAAELASRCFAEPTVFDYEQCERIVLSQLVTLLTLGQVHSEVCIQTTQLDTEHAREFFGVIEPIE